MLYFSGVYPSRPAGVFVTTSVTYDDDITVTASIFAPAPVVIDELARLDMFAIRKRGIIGPSPEEVGN